MALSRASAGHEAIDEAILHWAAAVAVASAVLASGWAGGSLRVGAAAAALVGVGVWASWHTRRWEQGRRAALGLLGGGLAGGSLQALISWEVGAEIGMLYTAMADVGMAISLRMSVVLVGCSFLLIGNGALLFSLVPALTLFGLSGARGVSSVSFGCFLVYLPAALAALSQGMVLSGLPVWRPEAEASAGGGYGRPRGWRVRHWSALGALTMAMVVLGALVYFPVFAYGTQYYWPLAMMSLSGGGLGFRDPGLRAPAFTRSQAVGQGPISPTENPVLSFEGPPAPLWRGQVFDVYGGSSWRSSDEEPLHLRTLRGSFSLQPSPDPDALPAPGGEGHPLPPEDRQLSSYAVRAEQDVPVVLYAPGEVIEGSVPVRLMPLLPDGLVVDKFGCIWGPRAIMPAGAPYQVSVDTAAFSAHRASAEAAPVSALDEAYLRVPLSSRRVADLARQVTARAEAPEDKIAAIIEHLNSRCTYTLNAPAVPLGEDAADFFLFYSRQGYCDLFATALAVMARAAGVPARFVTGYAGGRYDPQSGRYLLTEADAHAWVEVYLPPAGWVAADPAPAGGPVSVSRADRLLLAAQLFLRARPYTRILLVVVLGAAALAGVILMVRGWRSRAALAPDRNDPRAVVVRAYARLNRMLARRGLPRRPGQTPLEYLAALDRHQPSADRRALADADRGRRRLRAQGRSLPPASLAPIRALTETFVLARYGPPPVTVEAAESAVRCLSEATEAIRRTAR